MFAKNSSYIHLTTFLIMLLVSVLFLSIVGPLCASLKRSSEQLSERIPTLDAVSNTLWPLPASVISSGPPLVISPAFVIQTSSSSGVVKRGITRYLEIILRQIGGNHMQNPSGKSETLNELVLNVRSDEEVLRVDTSYWYMLNISNGQANIEAKTPYGAL